MTITTIAIVGEEVDTTATLASPSQDRLHEKTASIMVTTTDPLIGPTSPALPLARTLTATASPDLLLETAIAITIHITTAISSEKH
jgi:hypothetical protein